MPELPWRLGQSTAAGHTSIESRSILSCQATHLLGKAALSQGQASPLRLALTMSKNWNFGLSPLILAPGSLYRLSQSRNMRLAKTVFSGLRFADLLSGSWPIAGRFLPPVAINYIWILENLDYCRNNSPNRAGTAMRLMHSIVMRTLQYMATNYVPRYCYPKKPVLLLIRCQVPVWEWHY